MARVKNLDQITGNLKNLSFYTRKGSDGIIVRTKGGATKEKIKRDPAFAGLRKANKEFGGCSKMGKQIRMAFYGLEHVADYNLSAVLNRLSKDIQKTDTVHPVGERDIRFSAYRFLLKGFDFGRTTRFASMLRVPLAYTLLRQRQEAVLHIPAFACSFGLNMQDTRAAYSYFRITAALGIVTDMTLNPQNQQYEPVHDKLGQGYRTCSTEWYSTQGSVPEQELSEEEASALLDQAQVELERWVAAIPNPDSVEDDLDLPERFCGGLVTGSWQSDCYDLMDASGQQHRQRSQAS